MSVRETSRASVDVPPVVEVHDPAGSVTVEAVEGSTELRVRVEALDEVAEQLLDQVVIDVTDARPGTPVRVRVAVPERRLFRTPAFAVAVGTPAGAAVRVAVASAGVELRGPIGRAVLTSASGDCSVDSCTELQVRSASGAVRIDRVEGAATVGTASGDVHVESAGAAVDVRTASGDVDLGEVGADLSARTASGEVTVGRVTRGRVRLRTVSGDVTIGVVPGLRVWQDLAGVSGRVESELTGDDGPAVGGPPDLTVSVRTVSGDVRVLRTAPAG
jgi:hypothetical protein